MSHWQQFAGVPKIPKEPAPKTSRWRVQKCCKKKDHNDWWVINHFTKHIDSTHRSRTEAETAAAALNAAGP